MVTFPPFKAELALKYEMVYKYPEEEASAWSLETRLRTQNELSISFSRRHLDSDMASCSTQHNLYFPTISI